MNFISSAVSFWDQSVKSVTTFSGLIDQLVSLFLIATPVVGGAVILVFFWGVMKFVFSAGDEEAHRSGKTVMIWGLIALFVMFSVWGILRLFSATFFPGFSI